MGQASTATRSRATISCFRCAWMSIQEASVYHDCCRLICSNIPQKRNVRYSNARVHGIKVVARSVYKYLSFPYPLLRTRLVTFLLVHRHYQLTLKVEQLSPCPPTTQAPIESKSKTMESGSVDQSNTLQKGKRTIPAVLISTSRSMTSLPPRFKPRSM